MEAALKAADNLAKAVEKFAEALRSVPDPNSLVNVNNSATTPSIELSKLTSTDFVVVDKVPDNGGVGAAVRGGSANGRNLVSFHWDAIDGSGGDYASPNYTNQQGMMAMVGHELGHLSNEGERFHNDSHAFFDREVAEGLVRNGTYNSTEYWRNTEAWAHSFSTSLAVGVGIDISGWRPNEGTFWQSPREIYLERTRPKR